MPRAAINPLLSCYRYDNPAIALNCGSMLRDCIRDESIARYVPHYTMKLETLPKC